MWWHGRWPKPYRNFSSVSLSIAYLRRLLICLLDSGHWQGSCSWWDNQLHSVTTASGWGACILLLIYHFIYFRFCPQESRTFILKYNYCCCSSCQWSLKQSIQEWLLPSKYFLLKMLEFNLLLTMLFCLINSIYFLVASIYTCFLCWSFSCLKLDARKSSRTCIGSPWTSLCRME